MNNLAKQIHTQALALQVLLNTPKRWTKNSSARTIDGSRTHAWSPEAVRWCLQGAVEKVALEHCTGTDGLRKLVQSIVDEVSGHMRLESFNDRSFTGFKDIKAVIEKSVIRAQAACESGLVTS